jgi:hypothetical protein
VITPPQPQHPHRQIELRDSAVSSSSRPIKVPDASTIFVSTAALCSWSSYDQPPIDRCFANEPLPAGSIRQFVGTPFQEDHLKARAATGGRGYSSRVSPRFLWLPSLTLPAQNSPRLPQTGVWVSRGPMEPKNRWGRSEAFEETGSGLHEGGSARIAEARAFGCHRLWGPRATPTYWEPNRAASNLSVSPLTVRRSCVSAALGGRGFVYVSTNRAAANRSFTLPGPRVSLSAS